MAIQPTEQTTAERTQIEKDLRALKWQGIKARIQGQLQPADLKRIQNATHTTCGGMLFQFETGKKYCLNCGAL
ncbi:MAG: hypothetical protein M3R47_18530 [Chloroflexota bacterium]|nr:hypothetical protein [Chloroflexota bacterium]